MCYEMGIENYLISNNIALVDTNCFSKIYALFKEIVDSTLKGTMQYQHRMGKQCLL